MLAPIRLTYLSPAVAFACQRLLATVVRTGDETIQRHRKGHDYLGHHLASLLAPAQVLPTRDVGATDPSRTSVGHHENDRGQTGSYVLTAGGVVP
ncbi:MAG: hypothetical protein QOE61_4112 [Micromonosporaceae bacterium]|nr:hypothetical protein [Micromonosporaceae bacterium]